VDAPTLAPLLQRDLAHSASELYSLAQAGLLQADGPAYCLSVELRAGIEEPTDSQAAILAYVQTHGRVTRREVVASCGLTEKQAEYRLRQLVQAGRLLLVGRGRNAHYILAG